MDGEILYKAYTLERCAYASNHFMRDFSGKQEIRSMEHVSAQCMLFLTPLSKLAHFKVIQGQRSCCQSIAHGVSYLTFIDPIVVSVTVFEIFNIKAIFPVAKINSTSGLTDMRILDFDQNNR